MKIPRVWIRYGNKLTLLAILLTVVATVCWIATLPSRELRRQGIHNAQKISGSLDYKLEQELVLPNVHATISPTNKAKIIVSGSVSNEIDIGRIQSLANDWSVDSVQIVVNVNIEDTVSKARPAPAPRGVAGAAQ